MLLCCSVFCSVLQCVAVCCSLVCSFLYVLYYILQRNTLHHTATHGIMPTTLLCLRKGKLPMWFLCWYLAPYTCYTLQHTATHCNTLHSHSIHINSNNCNQQKQTSDVVLMFLFSSLYMLYTATHCTTLQHTAKHYNIPQHTATHCNTLATYCDTLHYTRVACERAYF